MTSHTISHETTRSFSKLVNAYQAKDAALQPFCRYYSDLEGMQQAIADRKQFPVNREVLVEVLKEQYSDYDLDDAFLQQIESLKNENTFTVCTAHQPNLLTGYLYFFYKIIHAAKLADYLKTHFPDNHFVPVFYIGSEDNDFEELSVFRYDNQLYRWESKQKGAVGRMQTAELKPLLDELSAVLVPHGVHRDKIIEIIHEAYNGQRNIAQAIRHIVHSFLGRLGVVVLDADDRRLKNLYLSVMQEELIAPKSLELVSGASQKLNEQFQAQAYAREINLFYLKDNIRERIEKDGDIWKVVHTDIVWESKEDLLAELNHYPERFSPNVILRGPYQETILPDVAFIGGGSEVAYWMQLKELFDHYQIFFPALVLRQSALWMPEAAVKLQDKLQLSDADLFLPIDELKNQWTKSLSGDALDLSKEVEALQGVLDKIKAKAEAVDVTLSPASKAVKAKVSHLTNRLEKKMLRAQKRHLSDKMRQIEKLKSLIEPGGSLQERRNCFLELYLEHGEAFIDTQYQETLTFGESFLIVKE